MDKNLKLTGMLAPVLALLLLVQACQPSDEKLTVMVKEKVAALDSTIGVDVKGGVVTLTGTVAEESTKSAVEGSLQAVKGIRSIMNEITVKPPPPPMPVESPDLLLQRAIQSAVDSTGVKGVLVTVTAGEVTLSGDVHRHDMGKVLDAANRSRPAKVVNNLRAVR